MEAIFWPKNQYGGFRLYLKLLENKLRSVSLCYPSFESIFSATYKLKLEKFILMT